MKTIKIIDLLNKIANGEEIPERIKYNDYEYRYHNKKHGYCRSGYDCTYICLSTDYCLFNILNDEVEILEEEKKIPEKIKIEGKSITVKGTTFFREKDIEIFQKLSMEINEILDYLESEGE